MFKMHREGQLGSG